jgi:hypothetical protein
MRLLPALLVLGLTGCATREPEMLPPSPDGAASYPMPPSTMGAPAYQPPDERGTVITKGGETPPPKGDE